MATNCWLWRDKRAYFTFPVALTKIPDKKQFKGGKVYLHYSSRGCRPSWQKKTWRQEQETADPIALIIRSPSVNRKLD